MSTTPNTPFSDMEKCPHCLAHYTKGYDHRCDPFMAALVRFHRSKKNTIEPDPETQNETR